MKRIHILAILLMLIPLNSRAQKFNNLGFDKACPDSASGLCNWKLSWGDRSGIKTDSSRLLLQSNDPYGVLFLEQSARLDYGHPMQIITYTGRVRTKEVEGKGAGLNINLYDHNHILVGFKDMGGIYSLQWKKGTNATSTCSLSIVCPMDVVQVDIGVILFGKGKAWFDSCTVTYTPVEGREPSALARSYLQAVCDSIARHSLLRDFINMEEMKAMALQIAGQAARTSDCYIAVDYLLSRLRPLGDHHSFLMLPDELKSWEKEDAEEKVEYPDIRLLENCGYISVPGFHSGNKKLIRAFADSLQQGIKRLDASGIRGWVIDLRRNSGGNMEPMIMGLGPLFSQTLLGGLQDVEGKTDHWYYENGKYHWDSDTGWSIPHPVKLLQERPIAVLTSQYTGSSGEIVAISFIGNKHTRSFGQPTYGLTTGNGTFDLPDGARLFLASTLMADRNGKTYAGQIYPDTITPAIQPNSADDTFYAAVEWIRSQTGGK